MERPIIFSSEMVRALLDGRKTQTRRVIKTDADYNNLSFDGESLCEHGVSMGGDGWTFIHITDCPYGQPGAHLWVRETWGYWGSFPDDGWVIYRADGDKAQQRWRPSIHMPKKYARIWLEVIAVRAERVQDISEDDAEAEGVDWMTFAHMNSWEYDDPAREAFHTLWDSINKKRGYGWASNPWVWVVEFKRL